MRNRLFLAAATLPACLVAAAAQNWPSFRGPQARGWADGQNLPLRWNVQSGVNVLWKAPLPGVGHSSPVIWGNRVFVTTASSEGRTRLALGDEGGIDLADDSSPHEWHVYALDKSRGRIIWRATPFRGVPRASRHLKASQANSTPATDGRYLVAILGSEGLACLDLDGKLLWTKDLGLLDPGLFGDTGSQWGHSSSPVIFGETVIVQVDRHRDSFLAAFDLASGREVWRVERQEMPVWSTPTLHQDQDRTQLIVVGGRFVRGYDPSTGEELWRFADHAEVKQVTPLVAGDLIILTGGYPRGRPIYALRTSVRGDVSLDRGTAVVWNTRRGGPYTPTPIAYRGHLFVCSNNGVLAAYQLSSGELLNRRRLEGNFSASPVAADGRLYFASEEGLITVVEASQGMRPVARVDMQEVTMATPAISDGSLFVRTRSHLYAIARDR